MTEPTTPDESLLATLESTTGPKPGVRTSEFWATLTTFVVMMLPVLHITAAPATVRDVMGAVGGLVVAAYALSRAIVKAAHAKPALLPPTESVSVESLPLAPATAAGLPVKRTARPRRTR